MPKYYKPSVLSLCKINIQGQNSGSVLRDNRALLLSLIKSAGVISRTELAHQTALKNATITIIIKEFLENGLVQEIGLINGKNGRRVMGICMANNFCTVAVRLSTSYIAFGVYDIYLKNLYINKVFLDTLADLDHTYDVIEQELKIAQTVIPDKKFLGIGIAVESPCVIKDNRYQFLNKRTGEYFDIGKELYNRTALLVIVNRMCNFSAYRIWQSLWKRNTGVVIAFNISYTVECGIMINGETLSGEQGLPGQIGNIVVTRNKDGSQQRFKDLISVQALLSETLNKLPGFPDSVLNDKAKNLNIRDVIQAYLDEDPLALMIYNECAKNCGHVLSILIELLNPDVIFCSDEVPLTLEYTKLVYNETIRHLGCPTAVRFAWMDNTGEIRQMDENDQKVSTPGRLTKYDPSLRGAAEYILDAILGETDYEESNIDKKMDANNHSEADVPREKRWLAKEKKKIMMPRNAST